jgi:DNA-binding NarL/FixJ family response regulator
MTPTVSEKTMTTVDQDVPVLIIARPSRRRDSLRTLLKATPRLRIVDQVDDASSALKMVAEHRPGLLVLDAGLPDDGVWMVLRQVKAEWHQTRCLVLVDTIQQRQMAETANADGILVNGFSIDEFFTAIDRLLSARTALNRTKEQC